MSFAFMPLYTGDYLRDTRHLTPLRHGVYLLALMHCWDSKGPMPLDESEAAGICNCRSADEVDALRYVLSRYFVKLDDGYYNPRIAEEVRRSEVLSKARAEAGRAGGIARAHAMERAAKDAIAHAKDAKLSSSKQVPSNCQASAKQEPLPPPPPPPPDQEKVNPIGLTVRETAHQGEAIAVNCPHREVLALWGEMLPAMPQHDPALWTGARAANLRARWRECATTKRWRSRDEGLAYFRKLFAYVGKSPFLTGRVDPPPGRRPFLIELEWLVRPTNWARVIEGKYHQTTGEPR